MNEFGKWAGAALALGLIAACGNETAANGNGAAAEADTSRNWVEVVAKTDEGGFRMGNPNAAVQLVEYASLTCPHCAEFSETGFDALVENYVAQGLVSFEIRNFVRDPLDLTAALLSRCQGADAYFTITERMFENQEVMFQAIQGADQARLQQVSNRQAMESGEAYVVFAEAAGLTGLVGSLGIPEPRVRECLADSGAVGELENIRAQAINQHNLPGTPTFLINGEVANNVVTWPQLEARLRELTQ